MQDTQTPKNSSSQETNISVTKVGDVTKAAPSTLVKFKISVNNTSKCKLTQVVVKDELPAGMTYKSSYPPANTSIGAIIWNNVGPLDVDACKTIKLVAEIGENGYQV